MYFSPQLSGTDQIWLQKCFLFFFPLVKCQVCILQREDIFSKMKINEYKPIKSVKALQVTLIKYYSTLKAAYVHIF